MIEKLPVPFGLVRYGLAPDKQGKKRKVSTMFSEIAKDRRFNFYGNVNFQRDISLEELKKCCDCIILASGSNHERTLNIEGENLNGVIGSRALSLWYNGHPESQEKHEYISNIFQRAKEAVVIGNVALDIARICTKQLTALKELDIPESRLEVLAKRNIQKVSIFGRRGPYQSSFCCKELAKMREMEGVSFSLNRNDLELTDDLRRKIKNNGQRFKQKKINELKAIADSVSIKGNKIINFEFYKKPVKFEGDENGNLVAVHFEKTYLDISLFISPY